MSISRIGWLDIAKGIAILLMVMGHTAIPGNLSKYIWSFHMPLFFLVSGLMYNDQSYNSFSSLLIKRVKTLFIPYCFFTLIVYLGYTGTPYQNPEELYMGWKGYALWFMPVLFFANILLYFVAKTKKQYKILLLACSAAILGFVLSNIGVHLPFKIEVVPFAMFFVLTGYIFKESILNYTPKWWICLTIGFSTIILSQILPKLDMCENDFGIFGFNLFNALMGIAFVFMISYYGETRLPKLCIPIKWAGKNSLFIMAFSQLFNYWILTGLDKLSIPHIIALPMRYIILFGAIYIVSEALNKYLPFLVGRR